MKRRTPALVFTLAALGAVLSACGGGLTVKLTPTVEPAAQASQAREGQPAFPKLGQYWVVDQGCNFDREKVRTADEMFEKLRTDGIAEVAVVCQAGIVDNGPMNNDKIWLRDWARWAKMGDVENDRSVVWLIRPDVKEEGQVVAVEVSRWLYWYTAIDYTETLSEASNYANQKDFDGALVAIARGVDHTLRQLWQKQPQ